MKLVFNQHGFTYILALTTVMIMGIMLGLVGQSWKDFIQRELEEEMIFRGDQVAEIIHQKLLCKQAPPPTNPVFNDFLWEIGQAKGTILDELTSTGRPEKCRDGSTRTFRLRPSAAIDPMTNKPWKIVSPVGKVNLFAGVASESLEEPFRKTFSAMYDSKILEDKKHYSEWAFTWELKQDVSLSQNQTSPANQNLNLPK